MHVQLYELAQKYGPVMKIYIFTKPVVVLNTADVIHEALIKRGIVYLNVVHLNSLLKTKMIKKKLVIPFENNCVYDCGVSQHNYQSSCCDYLGNMGPFQRKYILEQDLSVSVTWLTAIGDNYAEEC